MTAGTREVREVKGQYKVANGERRGRIYLAVQEVGGVAGQEVCHAAQGRQKVVLVVRARDGGDADHQPARCTRRCWRRQRRGGRRWRWRVGVEQAGAPALRRCRLFAAGLLPALLQLQHHVVLLGRTLGRLLLLCPEQHGQPAHFLMCAGLRGAQHLGACRREVRRHHVVQQGRCFCKQCLQMLRLFPHGFVRTACQGPFRVAMRFQQKPMQQQPRTHDHAHDREQESGTSTPRIGTVSPPRRRGDGGHISAIFAQLICDRPPAAAGAILVFG